MTTTPGMTVGKPLDDVGLASFHGSSGSCKCVVTVSNGSVTMTGNCEGVKVKER